jgi:type I restriction enzyme M protein
LCKIFLPIAENHRELILLVGSIEFTNVRRRSMDVLGRVFEYFLAKSSPAPKSRVSGQFYHSSWAVKILTPRHGRTHDLRSGSGGMTRENLKGPGYGV